jgi:hypothetical protein
MLRERPPGPVLGEQAGGSTVHVPRARYALTEIHSLPEAPFFLWIAQCSLCTRIGLEEQETVGMEVRNNILSNHLCSSWNTVRVSKRSVQSSSCS